MTDASSLGADYAALPLSDLEALAEVNALTDDPAKGGPTRFPRMSQMTGEVLWLAQSPEKFKTIFRHERRSL